jgi:hypothetical protein
MIASPSCGPVRPRNPSGRNPSQDADVATNRRLPAPSPGALSSWGENDISRRESSRASRRLTKNLGAGLCLGRASSGHELENENNEGDDEDEVNQTAGHLEGEAERPHHEKDNKNCPEHIISRVLP